jgi:transposase
MTDEGGRSKALSEEIANLLVLDYREGASLRQVAKIYGVSYTTAHRICSAAGVLRDRAGRPTPCEVIE